MVPTGDTIAGRAARTGLLCLAALAAAVAMTWPLASDLAGLDRTADSGDARFSVWNIAWVAHALTSAPGRLFDANIYYPHAHTLAFSEANIVPGALAVPIWLLTGDAHVTHNVLLIAAFAASVVTMWLLARRLTGDGAAAATAAVMFAFCPFLFSHTTHIQLLMAAGLPLTLLALHRTVDAPSVGSGALLGGVLALQALSCAYYGIFAGLIAAYGAVFYAVSRRAWASLTYWAALAAGATLSIALVTPFFLPYVRLQAETGFGRSLADAVPYSATVRSYLASASHAHNWMLPLIGDWNHEVLFPGFLALGLGLAGAVITIRRSGPDAALRDRETATFYAGLGLLAFWVSLGPRAGLYALLYHTIPVFSLLRAPGRTGLLVTLALAVLSAFAVRRLRARAPRQAAAIGAAVCVVALAELSNVPVAWRRIRPIPEAYTVLAKMPKGPVAVFPFYGERASYHEHTVYMLESTVHWQPLLNGYSDFIPPDFRVLAARLSSFPSDDSFLAMRDRRVRYIAVHRDRYGARDAREVEARLVPYLAYLRPVVDDGRMVIYEAIGWP
jgi:hypothetical protein